MSLALAGHQVQTSVADLLERLFRFKGWAQKYLLGCGECPCEPCSAPVADYVYDLQYDADGHVLDKSLDLSCVLPSDKFPGEKVITINDKVRNCELTGCDGISVNQNCKVYLTNCNECDPCVTENCSDDTVRVFLTNNGEPVTEDQYGNPVPESYLLGAGELKYLCIVNGRIVKIVN
jgi:hypothetical protein